MNWTFAHGDDIGGRAEQQDHHALFHEGNMHLLVLADGMGGLENGAAASRIVIDTAQRHFTADFADDPEQSLGDICQEAHRQITELGEGSAGSTIVALFLHDSEAYWAHVGDSRLYHFSNGNVVFQTRDHTVAELTRGQDGQMAGGINQHELYMCLGGKNTIEPEIDATRLMGEDCFMLCSDGLWNVMTTNDISRQLHQEPRLDPQHQVDALIETARRHGGTGGDNISVILARRDGKSASRGLFKRLFQR